MTFSVDNLLKEASEALSAQSTDAILKELLPEAATIAPTIVASTEGESLEKEAGIVDFWRRDVRSFARLRPGGRGFARALSKADAETYQGLIRAGSSHAKEFMESARAKAVHLDHLEHAVKGVSDPEGRAKVVQSFLRSSSEKRKAGEALEAEFNASLKLEQPVKSFNIRKLALPAAAIGGGVVTKMLTLDKAKKKKEPSNVA